MDATLEDLGVLRPGEPGYSQAVNAMTGHGSPELVARPRTAEHVAAAVHFARTQGLELTVRAGGHSMAGLTTATGGLLLDLRAMHQVEVEASSALVRIGGGACWGQVAEELAPHGLGLTAGDTSSVGVGGLTLGGGIGWMVRRYGLAIDSLLGAELVTADGAIRQVSEDEHPDLFWALRGGGGNLGVVTRFDFRAQPVTDVVFGTVLYALDAPRPLLTRWRDFQCDADERLTTVLTLLPAMGDQPAAATLELCFAGSWEEAGGVLDELPGLGTMLSNDVDVRPYAGVLEDVDHPPGMRVAVDSAFLAELSDAALAEMAGVYDAAPTILSVRALGGAFARVPAAATAFGHRSAQALAIAMRFTADTRAPVPTEITGWEAVARHGMGSYVNFLSAATDEAVAAAYPEPTMHRLAAIKAEYDPGNLFRRTHNVRPQGPGA